jgi:GrpB-like predicted nucleotidyltransferase (UPF0157 family)
VAAHDPAWPVRFAELGRELRAGLGAVALRIDHIGSTSVPGLAAKPIIDIQVSVADFEPLAAYRLPLEQLGYVYRAGNPERTKRYFREPPGRPRTHVHVRRLGSFSEQWALLFRDYLRAHPEVAAEYDAVKRRLAVHYRDDRRGMPRPRSHSRGRSSAGPMGGPRPRGGSPAPATPDQTPGWSTCDLLLVRAVTVGQPSVGGAFGTGCRHRARGRSACPWSQKANGGGSRPH